MDCLQKIWQHMPTAITQQRELCHDLGISPVVANLLINRKITDTREAEFFLFGKYEDTAEPFRLKDMKKAVERIRQAIHCQEKITIYGDYDVDGITSSSLMVLMLQKIGAKVEYYIPERESEGYGLNHIALQSIVDKGTSLIVTVDCGISAVDEISHCPIDIIVTDHHQPPAILPAAFAVINPKQNGCQYPEKNLAGVGVAFKLCQALGLVFNIPTQILKDFLDIVALGTIADIVPLVGENHILVKLGLDKLKNTNRYGLQALIEVCGLKPQEIDAGKVGFMLAPRLNAAGRMSNASAGVALLTTPEMAKAQELAQLLNTENTERQMIERQILQCAEQTLEEAERPFRKVLVIAGQEWHAGVIGIVASRLVDKYYCPVVMISVQQGIGKGSCRSIPGFDIYKALAQCSDLLIKFGGHEQAAGLSIEEQNIPAFEEKLNQVAKNSLTAEDFIPKLKIDDIMALEQINDALMEQIAVMEPFGMGNPSPLFACKDVTVLHKKAIGQQGKHLKLKVKKAQAANDVLAWNMGAFVDQLQNCEVIDLAFAPVYNEWLGQRQIQLRAKDIKFSSLRIVDYRHHKNRIEMIREIIKSDRSLVYVGSKDQKEKIRPWLLPGSCCLQLGEYEHAETEKTFDHIIMATLDMSWDSFIKHCCQRMKDHTANIYLLYGAQDMQAAHALLWNKAPDRQGIAMIYFILKKANGCLSFSEIVDTVNKKWPAFNAEGAKICLKVLEELQLVVQTNQTYALTQQQQKKDLMQSVTFQQSAHLRERFQTFTQQLLQLPFYELSSLIRNQFSRLSQED